MRAVVSLELDYTTYYNDADKITDDDEREAFYKNSPRLTLDKVEKLKAEQPGEGGQLHFHAADVYQGFRIGSAE